MSVNVVLNENLFIKRVIRSRNSKKDRQYNSQKKKDKRTNKDLQNTPQKTKDRTTKNQEWIRVLQKGEQYLFY
jgi:hypothetical protein